MVFVYLICFSLVVEFTTSQKERIRPPMEMEGQPWIRNMTVDDHFLQCAYSLQWLIRPSCLKDRNISSVGGTRVPARLSPHKEGCLMNNRTAAIARSCGFTIGEEFAQLRNSEGKLWPISGPSTLQGIDEVVFIGDSTLMRSFMDLVGASEANYTRRVANLQDAIMETEIVVPNTASTSPKRKIRVKYYRSLHVAVAWPELFTAFNSTVGNRSLIFLGYGPHDTSWLVFRRAMPHYRRGAIGHWDKAQKYWNKHIALVAMHVAHLLQYRRPEDRPFVVFREHFFANCKHPKYKQYPLITRCDDLLNPHVIPWYRKSAQAVFGLLNIPVIGLDALFPPCRMVDAGHVDRWCKQFEIHFAAEAFRLAKLRSVVQGSGKAENVHRVIVHQLVLQLAAQFSLIRQRDEISASSLQEATPSAELEPDAPDDIPPPPIEPSSPGKPKQHQSLLPATCWYCDRRKIFIIVVGVLAHCGFLFLLVKVVR